MGASTTPHEATRTSEGSSQDLEETAADQASSSDSARPGAAIASRVIGSKCLNFFMSGSVKSTVPARFGEADNISEYPNIQIYGIIRMRPLARGSARQASG